MRKKVLVGPGIEWPSPGAPDEHVKPKVAARVLDISERTLAKWRLLGRGPRHRKFGRCVRYSMNDLRAYAASCTKEVA